jgi:hypothetical protein
MGMDGDRRCTPMMRSYALCIPLISAMATPRNDQDSPWKLMLRQYFPEAIAFFFPAIAPLIDWTQPIEFLDKEFQRITPDAEIGKRFADQLVRVQAKRGQP